MHQVIHAAHIAGSHPFHNITVCPETSGTHLLEIINEILDFSKLEAGRYEVHPEPVDLDVVCHTAIQMVVQQARKKNLRMSVSVHINANTIILDPHRLKQILVNLLNNAIKFTNEGGKVGLEVSQDNSADTLTFMVWDTGIGIPADQIAVIFQPFTQLDSTLSRQYEGAGLGLALVHRLVDLMGGSIGVESDPGQGSKFWFILPVRSSKNITRAAEEDDLPVETEGAQTMAVDRQSRLVMVAEDHFDNLESLSDVLKAKGYRIISATNGLEVVERAEEFHPDIILMDIQMPVMDGLEATRRLRAMPAFAHTRIIALTALVMPGDRERCMQAGADVYLAKPVNTQKLLEAIRSAP